MSSDKSIVSSPDKAPPIMVDSTTGKVVTLDDLVNDFLHIYSIFSLELSLNRRYLLTQLGKYDATFHYNQELDIPPSV